MPGPLVMAGIGAGMGLLGGLFGSNKPQEQISSIDPQSQQYELMRRAYAQNIANTPLAALDPAYLQALSQTGDFAGLGLDAFRALNDPAAMAQRMNPYLNAMNPMYDQMRAQAELQNRQAATRAGAFGVRGSMMGADLSGINSLQSQGAANAFEALRSQLMNQGALGFNASQALGGMGQWLTNRGREWQMGGLEALQRGFGQNLYTKTTQPTQQGNVFQNMMGGAMMGLSFAGPGGGARPAPAASFLPGYVPGGRPVEFPTFGAGGLGGYPQVAPTGFGQGY